MTCALYLVPKSCTSDCTYGTSCLLICPRWTDLALLLPQIISKCHKVMVLDEGRVTYYGPTTSDAMIAHVPGYADMIAVGADAP